MKSLVHVTKISSLKTVVAVVISFRIPQDRKHRAYPFLKPLRLRLRPSGRRTEAIHARQSPIESSLTNEVKCQKEGRRREVSSLSHDVVAIRGFYSFRARHRASELRPRERKESRLFFRLFLFFFSPAFRY